MNLNNLFEASLTLFAIVNPIGSIPLFLQLTGKLSPQARAAAFRTGALTSLAILFIFVFVGQGMLDHFFRIAPYDLEAAGGLLLLVIAIDHLVFGALAKSVVSSDGDDAYQIGAVPIACPILAGPGAMMTVFVNYMDHGFGVAAASILIVMGLTWVIMASAETIYRALGKVVCIVLSKILCLFLAAVGIRLLMEGLRHYWR